MDVTYTVSITDIIQAIGVGIGFPAAVWGIFQLFRKDKDKERQLLSLKDIAISQNAIIGKMTEQIEQLALQTAQLEYQSSIFKEANDLLQGQIKLQTEALLHDKKYKARYLELEGNKRKSEIRPFLKPGRKNASGKVFSIFFTNLGERAFFTGIQEVDISNISVKPFSRSERVIEKGEAYEFQAVSISETFSGRDVPFEVNILFDDEDGNHYHQNLKGCGLRATTETPIEQE